MLGYIANGKYIRGQPKLEDMVLPRPSPLAKAQEHDAQRQDHQYELIQARDASGKPNPAFISA
jgi:hypothetical protein